MITIKEEKPSSKKFKPYYKLRYNYMIGDADGDTREDVEISVNNPFIERYYKLLNSLECTSGYCGISLDQEKLKLHLKEKQITDDDYEFLKRMMFESKSKFEVPEEHKKYANEFFSGVRSDTEYSYLSFEYAELFYYDEDGKKHKAEIS